MLNRIASPILTPAGSPSHRKSHDGARGSRPSPLGFVGQVERGQLNISLHNILKLAKGLHVDSGKFVQGVKPPQF